MTLSELNSIKKHQRGLCVITGLSIRGFPLFRLSCREGGGGGGGGVGFRDLRVWGQLGTWVER